MMLTEDEARQSPCIGPPGCGYINPADLERYCIASSCKMAWRWQMRIIDYPDNRPGPPVPSEKYGYCGLAGTPLTGVIE